MGDESDTDDLPEHWSSEIEIKDSWNTVEEFERVLKFHSIRCLLNISTRDPYFVSQT
jgi:hypothetical protein